MKFLCDAMLGGLAKWLRAAGYDARYAGEPGLPDHLLVTMASQEGRALLTNDGGFLEHRPVRDGEIAFLRVPPLPVEEQLRLAAERFDLKRLPSRCMECNGELETVPPGAVADRVPSGVIEYRDELFLCRGCGRVFWHGSHWRRIDGLLERVFG